METIFETPYVLITFHPELRMVKMFWKSIVTSEQYRTAFTKTLDYQKNNSSKIDNFLSDITHQGVTSPADRKWFLEETFPKALKSGLKRSAVISDANAFKRYYLNTLLGFASKKYNWKYKLVNKEQEAIEWFKSFYK